MEKIEIKHTPGPWTLHADWRKAKAVPSNSTNEGFAYKNSFIYGADGLIVGEAKALETDGFAKFDVYEANALLLCTAPLLLSALMKAVEDVEGYPAFTRDAMVLSEWYAEAKSAIAKATNTTQP
jgi:hypothetical protein